MSQPQSTKIDCERLVALDERRFELVSRLAWIRSMYPKDLEKKGDILAKMEAKYLKCEMEMSLPPLNNQPLEDRTIRLLNNMSDVVFPDSKPCDSLIKDVESLRTVVEQIKHDDVHKMMRESFDPTSILKKVEFTMINNENVHVS